MSGNKGYASCDFTAAPRISQPLLALAAGVALNHRLGRPGRALVNYTA